MSFLTPSLRHKAIALAENHLTLPLATVALALYCLCNIPFHPDFSAGQTITAKYLAGERPYIDIIENNPPMTFYLHVPSALLEQWTGLRGEIWQNALALLLCLAVVGLGEWLRTGRAIPQSRDSAQRVSLFLMVLLVMPMTSFGSRDQLTFVLLWPMLALYAEDMVKPRSHPVWVDVGIGLLAGLGTTIKFYFVLGPILACLYLCWIKRSFRPLFTVENITASLFCLAYLASIVLLHPDYLTHIYRMLPYTYFSGHPTLRYLLSNGLLVFTAFYAIIEFAKDSDRLRDPRTHLLMMASLGFVISYFAFSRNLPFRYLPPASCIFMALIAANNHSQRTRSIMFYEATFLLMCCWYMLVFNPHRYEATSFGQSLKLDRPKIMLLSADLGDGHPLIRDLGGTLVNPGLHPWVSLGLLITMEEPTTFEQRVQFARWIEWERNLTARAMQANPPDLILLENDTYVNWLAWARMHPEMAKMLDHYKSIGIADNLFFLVRRTPEEQATITPYAAMND